MPLQRIEQRFERSEWEDRDVWDVVAREQGCLEAGIGQDAIRTGLRLVGICCKVFN